MTKMKKHLTTGIALMLLLLFTCGAIAYAEPTELADPPTTAEDAAPVEVAEPQMIIDVTWNADGTATQTVYYVNLPSEQWSYLSQSLASAFTIAENVDYRGQKAHSLTTEDWSNYEIDYTMAATDKKLLFTTVASAKTCFANMLVYHLPIAAGFHDATLVEDGGKTLIWEVDGSEPVTASMVVYMPNVQNIVIVVAILLLLAALVVLLIFSSKKKKRLAAEEAFAAEVQQATDIYDMTASEAVVEPSGDIAEPTVDATLEPTVAMPTEEITEPATEDALASDEELPKDNTQE